MHNIAIHCHVGDASSVFKTALIAQLKGMNYHCNINFISFKVSNYFSLMDVTPMTPKVNVVYCHKGYCDKAQSYIGKTRRHLGLRVQERLSGKSGISAIYEHVS